MIREFFGTSFDDALEKASLSLGIPIEQISYQKLKQTFGRPLKPTKVGILVEFDESNIVSAKQVFKRDLLQELTAIAGDPLKESVLVLERWLSLLGFECQVSAREKDKNIILSVEFEDENLDFRRGEYRQFRSALQYLLNRALSEGRDPELRWIIDFCGNLDDRIVMLQKLGEEVSTKVVDMDQPLAIQLMDSQDRRLLHMALADEKSVATYSRGPGSYRVLCIKPRKEDERQEKKQD